MASAKHNKQFKEEIVVQYPLDEAIDFINRTLSPSDVFDDKDLEAWAEANGYVRSS